MPRICLPNQSVGPQSGTTQLIPDRRICLSHIGVGPEKGRSGVIIIFGSSGAIVFGSSGKIRF